MPKTKLGKWAGGLLAVFLVFIITVTLLLNLAGSQPGSPELIILGIFAGVAGIAAFFTGIVSLIKFKDRSFVVVLATIIGALAILMTIMETVEVISQRLTH